MIYITWCLEGVEVQHTSNANAIKYAVQHNQRIIYMLCCRCWRIVWQPWQLRETIWSKATCSCKVQKTPRSIWSSNTILERLFQARVHQKSAPKCASISFTFSKFIWLSKWSIIVVIQSATQLSCDLKPLSMKMKLWFTADCELTTCMLHMSQMLQLQQGRHEKPALPSTDTTSKQFRIGAGTELNQRSVDRTSSTEIWPVVLDVMDQIVVQDTCRTEWTRAE